MRVGEGWDGTCLCRCFRVFDYAVSQRYNGRRRYRVVVNVKKTSRSPTPPRSTSPARGEGGW